MPIQNGNRRYVMGTHGVEIVGMDIQELLISQASCFAG